MKPVTITILRGYPTFEDGTEETTLTVHTDELQVIDYYIEYVIVDGCEEYIILRDGVPFRWSMTDNKGVTHEAR
jgi:hypothetical protein